ncbi:MAG: hypothetical protein QXF12_04170 [Candidatus Aenigmatarchaeota archaeon]
MINPPISPIKEKLLKKYGIIDKRNNITSYHHDIFVKKLKEMEKEVENICEILENMKNKYNISILESLNLWMRDLDSPPKCIHCLTNKTYFKSSVKGWVDFCSNRCTINYNNNKILRELPKETRLEAVQIMKEYNFGCIEEAIYFIHNGYELKNKCKICGRPTEFKSYTEGYKILCHLCISKKFKNNKLSRYINKTKEERERIKKNISVVATKFHQYKNACYDIMIKHGIRTFSQAIWHLDKKDPECILGRCINCGRRFGFISYNVGYGLLGREKMCLSCRLKDKKTFFVNRIPLKERTIHEYYEHAFLKRLNFRTTKKLHSLRGEKILKSELEKDSNERKLRIENSKEKSKLRFIDYWGSSYKNNPLLIAKGYKLLEENLKKFKNYLEKNGFDFNVLDLIDNPYWLKKIFVDEGMTIEEISHFTGLSESMIRRRLKRLGYLKREKEYEEDENNDILNIMKKEPEPLFYQNLNYDDDDLEFELFKPFF